MSAEAVGWAFKHSPYSGAQLVVHLAIADVVNDAQGNEFFMSVDNLAIKARATRRTVQTALRTFVDEGFLEVVRHASQHSPTRYRFIFPTTSGAQNLHPSEPGAQSATPPSGAQSDAPRGANDDTPGAQSDAPRGAMVTPKPKEPKKNPRTSPSPSNVRPIRDAGTVAGDGDEEHGPVVSAWPRPVLDAAILASAEALASRVAAIGPVTARTRWLSQARLNWLAENAPLASRLLEQNPNYTPEDLRRLCEAVEHPSTRRTVREPCDECSDSGMVETPDGVIRCTCNPDLRLVTGGNQ